MLPAWPQWRAAPIPESVGREGLLQGRGGASREEKSTRIPKIFHQFRELAAIFTRFACRP